MKEARIIINLNKYNKNTSYDDEFYNINESHIHIIKP
jgi:hypothetical protein